MKDLQWTVSSLEKIFPKDTPKLKLNEYSIFKNERFHFQVACFSMKWRENISVTVESDLAPYITVRTVDLIPARFALYEDFHDNFILKKHGNNELYPDLLRPLREKGEIFRYKEWCSFWITVAPDTNLPVGEFPIKVRVKSGDGAYDKTSCFRLEVIDAVLPKQRVEYTNWMHYDCIGNVTNTRPFTSAFYDALKNYIKNAVEHGVNVIYTPLFTPALDTAVGEYRQTAQLVKVRVENGGYVFDFSEVEYFLQFAEKLGMERFELCHLASQHGAANAVKVVDEDGNLLFGWHTPSGSKEYLGFLDEFLRALREFLERAGYIERVYFHVSDEPSISAIENYEKVSAVIRRHFENGKIMDAMGRNEYQQRNLLSTPVVVMDKYDALECDWVYYCGAQRTKYITNRLFSMPLVRTRVLGVQLFRNDIKGFLHWGFNFYNSVKSLFTINPYCQTDGAYCFDSGDSFIVYPHENGVLDSIRGEAIGEAFADYRALDFLAERLGKDEVVRWLNREGYKKGFSVYPHSAKRLLRLRLKINEKVKEIVAKR